MKKLPKRKSESQTIPITELPKWRELLDASAELVDKLQQQNLSLRERYNTACDKQILLLNKLIEAEDRADELNAILLKMVEPGNELVITDPPHLNPADQLPPVACPLLIEVCGELVRAERTGIIANRADEMGYRLADGSFIQGRFPWTYP